MTDKLTPVRCGCGGEAKVQRVRTLKSHVLVVMCTKCEIATNYYVTEAEAIEAWNRAMGATDIHVVDKERTAKVEEDEWTEHKMLSRDYGKIYYQHDCCCDLYESPYQFCPYCGKKMKRKNHE